MTKKERFTETAHCTSQVHCEACRTSEKFRRSIMDTFEWDGECPHGYTADNYPTKPAGQKKKMPPAHKQAANLAKAVGRAAKALATGNKIVADQETQDERIRICKSCEFLRGARCRVCGCYTTKKIALATEACPKSKWPAVSDKKEPETVINRTGKDVILVWRQYMYRKAQEKPLREKIEESGFDYAYTTSPDLKAWVKEYGKPAAMIRWDESAGVQGQRRYGKKLTKLCYDLGIAPLYVDFGYFDHYNAYLFDWYARNGDPSIMRSSVWNSLPESDSWRAQQGKLAEYFEAVHKAYEAASRQGPFVDGEYIVAFAQCTARRCRLPMPGTNTRSWLEQLVKHVGKDRLVVKYPPAHGGLHHPEGVRAFDNKGKQWPGNIIEPPPNIRELNANLIHYARAVVSNTSSVSNELLIRNIPIFMTGKSWFTGLNVFDEVQTWEEIGQRRPVLGDESCRNKFAHWWLQHREEFKKPNTLLRDLVEQWKEQSTRPSFSAAPDGGGN